MQDLMYDLYTIGGISNQAVSVNSAFICMLHLANEKTLRFETNDTEADFIISEDS